MLWPWVFNFLMKKLMNRNCYSSESVVLSDGKISSWNKASMTLVSYFEQAECSELVKQYAVWWYLPVEYVGLRWHQFWATLRVCLYMQLATYLVGIPLIQVKPFSTESVLNSHFRALLRRAMRHYRCSAEKKCSPFHLQMAVFISIRLCVVCSCWAVNKQLGQLLFSRATPSFNDWIILLASCQNVPPLGSMTR